MPAAKGRCGRTSSGRSHAAALLGSFDVVRIFKHVARIMGAKDVDEFIIQGGIPPIDLVPRPDAEVAAGAASGRLAPIGK